VIGEMDLKQVKIGVDVVNQAGATRQEEHGADAARAEPLDAIAEFIVNIARGHHRYRAFPFWRVGQSFLNSPLPFLEESLLACFAFSSDSSTHSKASLSWKNKDVKPPLLFQKLRGLSSLFS